jgi:hypothetical protein
MVEIIKPTNYIFGVTYADQNKLNHAALVAAMRNGKIEAHSE